MLSYTYNHSLSQFGKAHKCLDSFINTQKIVKLFHFIWVGPYQIPEEYIEYIRGWIAKHPDWQFCFWTDANIPELDNQDLYDAAEKMAMKADILRYELLYKYGGVYVDCDFKCQKNIWNKIKKYSGFSAYESKDFIAIGLMGFRAGHPFLRDVLSQARQNISSKTFDPKDVSKITGPVMFTKLWNQKKYPDLYAFQPDFCYPYTFQDNWNGIPYKTNPKSYAVHMWGNSWQKSTQDIPKQRTNFKHYLADLMESHDGILFTKIGRRTRIVHIMGYFYSGGIERLMWYFDKYGDHQKYQYYLLFMEHTSGKTFYPIKNMNSISYKNQEEVRDLLVKIRPHLVVDHVSMYFSDNKTMFQNYPRDKIFAFVHSAIKYNYNITEHEFYNCINLYHEANKHPSWEKLNNHYVTLGTELKSCHKTFGDKIRIGIVGRIAQEKLPIKFLEKLTRFQDQRFTISIWGEQDEMFGKDYNKQFDALVKDSHIKYHGFLDSDQIYPQIDVLLIPSEFETGSFTCIEALNQGVVVIARDVYGMKFLINQDIGYLANSDQEFFEILKELTQKTVTVKSFQSYLASQKYDIRQKILEMEKFFHDYI